MGYARYELPDGREAGYAVEATCDQFGCTEATDRGLGFLCGDSPDGHRGPDEPGCGRYLAQGAPVRVVKINRSASRPVARSVPRIPTSP